MMYSLSFNKRKGVSLLEVLLASGIIGILLFVVVSSFTSVRDAEAVKKDAVRILSLLHDARTITLASHSTSVYGVYASSTTVVLFRGASYVPSDPENRVLNLNPKTEIGGVTLAQGGYAVVFDRLTGATEDDGTIVVQDVTDPSNAHTITIYETGLAEITS